MQRPKTPYRWLQPVPLRWGHAFASNMAQYEFERHLVPMDTYDKAFDGWTGEVGRFDGFSYIEELPKPRIYPGKKWART